MGIGKSHQKAKMERDRKLREEMADRFKVRAKTFMEPPRDALESREQVNKVCFVTRAPGETIEKDGLQYNVIESPEEETKPFAYPLNAKISKICF